MFTFIAFLSAIILGSELGTPTSRPVELCMPTPPPMMQPAVNVVYVIQRSGSMLEIFDYVKKFTISSINNLSPNQNFHVIFFAFGKPIENPPKKLILATAENKLQLEEFLRDIVPEGQTDPSKAMERAFQVRTSDGRKPDVIYLLSNGNFSVNLWAEIKRMNVDKTMINTVAFISCEGSGSRLLEVIAKDSGGTFKILTQNQLDNELEKVTSQPAITPRDPGGVLARFGTSQPMVQPSITPSATSTTQPAKTLDTDAKIQQLDELIESRKTRIDQLSREINDARSAGRSDISATKKNELQVLKSGLQNLMEKRATLANVTNPSALSEDQIAENKLREQVIQNKYHELEKLKNKRDDLYWKNHYPHWSKAMQINIEELDKQIARLKIEINELSAGKPLVKATSQPTSAPVPSTEAKQEQLNNIKNRYLANTTSQPNNNPAP